MSSVESLSSDERRAYDLITSRGALTQSELWKELDADSRTGSRLATSLAEKGLIEREETTRNGRRTYLLRPTDEGPEDADRSPGDDEPATPESSPDAAGREAQPEDIAQYNESALSLVRDRGALPVEDLAVELDVPPGTAERIAERLETRGAVERVDGDGRSLVRPVGDDLDFSLLMAGEMISPLVPGEEVDPVESDEFTEWILRLPHEG